MKHLKSFCIAMAMLATLSLVSCNKDDDKVSNSIDAKYIFGSWEEEFPESIAEALDRSTLYGFYPYTDDHKSGGFTIHVYHVTGGLQEVYLGSYTLSNAGILQTFIKDENEKEQLFKKFQVYNLALDHMELGVLGDGNQPYHSMQMKKRTDIN